MQPDRRSASRWILATLLVAMGATGVASAQPSKTLTFATDPTYAPFEFTKDGALTGFDIDLARAIGKAANFNANFESVPFDGIIPALKAGTYDGSIAAILVTDERAKSVTFSQPYFETGNAIAVRFNDTSIHGEADLRGKRIAVEIGSVGAEKAATIPDAKISSFNGTPATLLELVNGNADAVIGDAAALQYAATTGSVTGIKTVPGLISKEFYAVAFPNGSANVDVVNAGLKKVIDNGEYAAIYKKWFNQEPPRF